MRTIRLTMAQALVRYLTMQKILIEGLEEPLFPGVYAIFGHGNVTCLGEALEAVKEEMPTWRGQNEQSMALAGMAFTKSKRRRQIMVATSSIGPGSTNLLTAAAAAHANLRRRVREEIRELQQKLELTTVYVTHDQEEALAVSDRIFVMNEAVIDQEGTPRQLYEEPVNLFVADFIGDANIVKAQILKIDGINAEVEIGGIRTKLPHRGLISGEVNVAIRPQSICLSQSGNENGIHGTILKAIYLGDHIEYTVDCTIGELFVIDNQMESKQNLDAAVSITLRTRGVSLIPES